MFTGICVFLLVHFALSRPRLTRRMLTDGTYMLRERTCMINGFFIWIVLMSHTSQYGAGASGSDLFVVKNIARLGQCCVATFFFYSGFGIMSSLHKKGKRYARELVTVRFPKLLLHTVVAVSVYLVLQTLFYGQEYPLSQILLSFVCWSDLGNSNWFIFISLTAYLLIAAGYTLCNRFGGNAVVASTALMLVAVIFFIRHRGYWWYDTCLCIPAGMLFFIHRSRIEAILEKLRVPAWVWGTLLVPLSLVLYHFMPWPTPLDNAAAILFAFGITLIFSCVRVRIQDKGNRKVPPHR